MPAALEELREKIDAADEELLTVLAKRQKLVIQAAEVKKTEQLPSYSPQREREVISRREEKAQALGLPPGLLSDIMKRILRESYKSTGTGRYPCLCPQLGDVVIAGGCGGMGRIFTRYFESSGYKVFGFGHLGWDKLDEYLEHAGVVIVTVPIDLTVEVIEKLGPHLNPHMILCDFTSVKTPAVEAMLRCHKGPVLGLHPMFGPDIKSLVKQVIAYVPARDEAASAGLVEQMKLWGARLYKCTAEDHDHAMSIIQALRHFTTYCYGVFLADLNPDLHKILELSSPIYRMELMMVGRLFAQNPRLYADIIMSSRQNCELITSYVQSLKPELELVAKADTEEFTRRFLKAREYFGSWAEQFLQESGSLLAKLQDERN